MIGFLSAELSVSDEDEDYSASEDDDDDELEGADGGDADAVETSIHNDFESVVTALLNKKGLSDDKGLISRRLLGSIRGSEDVASSAVLSKIWDTPANDDNDDDDASFQDDLRAASGIGKKGKGRGKVRQVLDLASNAGR